MGGGGGGTRWWGGAEAWVTWPLSPPMMLIRVLPGIGAAGGGRDGGGRGVSGGGGGVEGRGEGAAGGEYGGVMPQKIGAGEATLSTGAPMAALSAVALVTTACRAKVRVRISGRG